MATTSVKSQTEAQRLEYVGKVCLFSFILGQSADEEVVVVSCAELVKTLEDDGCACAKCIECADKREIHRNGHMIAQTCTDQFNERRDYQSRGWAVAYLPELQAFVAVKRTHSSLRHS